MISEFRYVSRLKIFRETGLRYYPEINIFCCKVKRLLQHKQETILLNTYYYCHYKMSSLAGRPGRSYTIRVCNYWTTSAKIHPFCSGMSTGRLLSFLVSLVPLQAMNLNWPMYPLLTGMLFGSPYHMWFYESVSHCLAGGPGQLLSVVPTLVKVSRGHRLHHRVNSASTGKYG